MEKNKFEKLDAVVKQLGFTKKELKQWFYSRKKRMPTEISEDLLLEYQKAVHSYVETPCPIAYCNQNQITIERGLDLSKKDLVWGIQLANKVIVSTRYYKELDWEKSEELAGKFFCSGMQSQSPFLDLFTFGDSAEPQDFVRTQEILSTFGIPVDISPKDKAVGFIWTKECYSRQEAYYITIGSDGYYRKIASLSSTSDRDRLGIVFLAKS